MIIDSGSCINAISTDTVKRLGLTPVDHPSPYRVSWIDSSSIPIKFRCRVPIQLHSYQDHVWCDVLPMEVESIILGRPWLFDNDVTIYGRTNSCSFTHQSKKITINPSPPKATNRKIGDGPKENLKKKSLHLIGTKELEMTMSEDHQFGCLLLEKFMRILR